MSHHVTSHWQTVAVDVVVDAALLISNDHNIKKIWDIFSIIYFLKNTGIRKYDHKNKFATLVGV